MSKAAITKSSLRKRFSKAVLARDGQRCRKCGVIGDCEGKTRMKLSAHHIIDRNNIEGGGYVVENGITLCDGARGSNDGCHWLAEQYHLTGFAIQGYSQADLFALIGSSEAKAREAAAKAALRRRKP